MYKIILPIVVFTRLMHHNLQALQKIMGYGGPVTTKTEKTKQKRSKDFTNYTSQD
jgi:hypothetical protein